MQPFDALTIRAVLEEAKPLLINRKVDKVHQLGRDEILLTLRSKAGMINLLLSAQSIYGRVCLIKWPSSQQAPEKPSKGFGGGGVQSNFSLLLRKNLIGATLVAVEQPLGERVVDFIFSCIDEVGGSSHKSLTVEIMGRHSNLIFWDRATQTVLCASHIVTKEMSRQREIAPGLRFERPPGQNKLNLFSLSREEFDQAIESLKQLMTSEDKSVVPATLEQWMINAYTGLGRHLASELVASVGCQGAVPELVCEGETKSKIWEQIKSLQSTNSYHPAMKNDLSAHTVLSWWPGMDESSWKSFPSVNDMVEEYYRLAEQREQFNQLKERLRSELKAESDKLESRIAQASQHLGNGGTLEDIKRSGDLVLANIGRIEAGQTEIVCENIYESGSEPITVKLNSNISPAQNAQAYYRQFAKTRARQGAATVASNEAKNRLEQIRKQMGTVESASSSQELQVAKEQVLGRKAHQVMKAPLPPPKKNKSRLLSVTSSDGWTIYVGRNRNENDYMMSKLAMPLDLWFHVQGQGGAHVLIRVPASKQEPPLTTIKEAAHVAAKLSKAAPGSKVRVVYTQCRYVKKIAREKPGVVRYENERTIEIDTAQPMPKCMRQLFQQ